MPQFTWAEFVEALMVDELGKDVAARLGVGESTLSRWRSGQTLPTPRQAIAVARHFGRNPLEALIAAGLLNAEEVDIPIPRNPGMSLRDYPATDLARELLRRAREAERAQTLESDGSDS